MALHGHLWSHMVPYGPEWSCMIPYGSMWTHMVLNSPVGRCMVPYGCSVVLYRTLLSCMIPYGPGGSWIDPCGPVWSSLVPYGPVLLSKFRLAPNTLTSQREGMTSIVLCPAPVPSLNWKPCHHFLKGSRLRRGIKFDMRVYLRIRN